MLLRTTLGVRPEVCAIYARNSYAQGHWVPGLSDIDLTLILRNGLELSEEYEFCRVFHRRYSNLRRFFPMLADLGEVEVLPASHVDARTSFAITGYESRTWKRLYGEHTLLSRYREEPERLRVDRLTHAVAVYHYLLLPSLTGWPEQDQISQLICRRSLLKILRYLEVPISPEWRKDLEKMDAIDAQLLALDHLAERTAAHFSLRHAHEARLDLRQLLDGRPDNIVHRKSLPPEIAKCESLDQAIDSIVAMTVSPNRLHVQLRAGLNHEQRRRAVAVSLRAFPNPLITERSVFEYYLNFVNVLDHISLLRDRDVYFGDDPFPLGEQPGAESFHMSVCQYAVDMFKYPFTPALWTASHNEFQSMLFGWFILTLRYLEEGVITSDFDELYEYCRLHHPEYENRVGSLLGVGPPQIRFTLVRLVLDDMSRHMNI